MLERLMRQITLSLENALYTKSKEGPSVKLTSIGLHIFHTLTSLPRKKELSSSIDMELTYLRITRLTKTAQVKVLIGF